MLISILDVTSTKTFRYLHTSDTKGLIREPTLPIPAQNPIPKALVRVGKTWWVRRVSTFIDLLHNNIASKVKPQLYLWSVNIADLQCCNTAGSGDEDQACDRCAVLTPKKQSDISRLNTKSHWKAKSADVPPERSTPVHGQQKQRKRQEANRHGLLSTKVVQ